MSQCEVLSLYVIVWDTVPVCRIVRYCPGMSQCEVLSRYVAVWGTVPVCRSVRYCVGMLQCEVLSRYVAVWGTVPVRRRVRCYPGKSQFELLSLHVIVWGTVLVFAWEDWRQLKTSSVQTVVADVRIWTRDLQITRGRSAILTFVVFGLLYIISVYFISATISHWT